MLNNSVLIISYNIILTLCSEALMTTMNDKMMMMMMMIMMIMMMMIMMMMMMMMNPFKRNLAGLYMIKVN